jgi:NAD+-dependent secondary alcohol dehydrogenase Adh1
MKAQVLRHYDAAMQSPLWVTYEEVAEPRLETSTDVIVRIGGAGVCRTDLHVIEGVWRPFMDPDGTRLLPMILGHENAGWIEAVGSEVTGLRKGDPVIVHPKITDGLCASCRRGQDMHAEGPFPGVDCDGGYAELLKTNVRNIVKLPATLSPRDVAAYADAGLTAYRAVKKAARLLLPGQTCVVIGAGGLGHIGIQCLKAMCAADVIAVDVSPVGLRLAQEVGADRVVEADGSEVAQILELTQGKGARAVIDFVGEHGTTSKGLKMTAAGGTYFIVGYGEDVSIPAAELVLMEKTIVGNLVGTWSELTELISLAERGRVELSLREYKLADANQALRDLHAGTIKGRAVLVP